MTETRDPSGKVPDSLVAFADALKHREGLSNPERHQLVLFEALSKHRRMLTALELRQLVGGAHAGITESLAQFRARLAAQLNRTPTFNLGAEVPAPVVELASRAFIAMWEGAADFHALSWQADRQALEVRETAAAQRADAAVGRAMVAEDEATKLRSLNEDLTRDLELARATVTRLDGDLARAIEGRDQATGESRRTREMFDTSVRAAEDAARKLRADHEAALRQADQRRLNEVGALRTELTSENSRLVKELEQLKADADQQRTDCATAVLEKARADHANGELRKQLTQVQFDMDAKSILQRDHVDQLTARVLEAETAKAAAATELAVTMAAAMKDRQEASREASEVAAWLRKRPTLSAPATPEQEEKLAHWESSAPAPSSGPASMLLAAIQGFMAGG